MAKLNKAGDTGSMGFLDIPQGDFREQVDVVADELRQLAGNAEIPEDPLNAPYTLYVNPYTGSDTFVGGQFNNLGSDLERRISNQRLECGYTEARPFKTINRAAIEAAIITSRSYLDTEAKAKALVTICLSSGEHLVENVEGLAFSANDFPAIADGEEPDLDKLATFNDPRKGAVILPRGCSLISLDLRKTIIRPATVPGFQGEGTDYENRRSIFKVTGNGYYYGVTFKDNISVERSHHLLHCFEFASEAELDLLYRKVLASFASAGINAANTATERTEFEIAAPRAQNASAETDSVNSASPYIYNCSIRSVYGLGGIFANGAEVAGFRSMVVAQFTGVSLQRDMRCWEEYVGGNWQDLSGSAVDAAAYNKYISLDPNNVRMRITRRSFHIRAVNNAVIQEVSVFCIGQGIHHWVENGGELTVTNSNSNWGGCAGLAEGFRDTAQKFDANYKVRSVRTAVDPLTLGAQITKIGLGFVDTATANNTVIKLLQDLTPGRKNDDQPEILDSKGYSLKGGDYIWIENPNGPDYRARLANNPYNGSNTITVQSGFETEGGVEPGADSGLGDFSVYPNLPDLRVYVRRFVDTRTVEQRRFSLQVFGQLGNRLPVRDYVLQPSDSTTWTTRISSIRGAEPVARSSDVRIELTYARQEQSASAFSSSKYYRVGDTVRHNNKHYIARVNGKGAFSTENFAENFVHMEQGYAPGGNFKNAQPILIFDKDGSGKASSDDLGNSISDPDIVAQIVSAVDYIGTYQQLQNFGVSNPTSLLELTDVDSRDTDVEASGYGFELRRPSNIRLFGHAWEWAGYLNYTKGLPDYQQTLNAENKFTYYFTNQAGGQVFCNGFNEEGLQVSPRGLEDVTTGEVISADNLSPSDREINTITELDGVKITNLTVKGYSEESDRATGSQYGIVRLYDENTSEDINTSNDVITYDYADNNFAKVQVRNQPFQIIHVVPSGITQLTGVDSIPYGFPDDETLYSNADGALIYKSVTDALSNASKIFVPAGSTILISVHGSSNKVEAGPLQLANGFAPVTVAGARGASVAPTLYLDKSKTKNALGRTPQYQSTYSFSAGITFADLTLDCDGAGPVIATMNGGFGVGGFDTTIIWRRCDRVAACATTYGGQATFLYYNEENTTRKFTQRVESTSSVDPTVQFFGAAGGSGLVSQGCDIVLDFRDPRTGDSNAPQCVFAYENSTGATPKIQFFDAGGRGGVKTGGRTQPVIDLDFSGKDTFNLKEFVGENFTQKQNYCGNTFKIRPIPSQSTPEDTYNIGSGAVNDLIGLGGTGSTDGVILRNGCCVDITSESKKECGPFGLYLEVEEYHRSTPGGDANYRLLRHDTSKNSYIYGGANARDVAP